MKYLTGIVCGFCLCILFSFKNLDYRIMSVEKINCNKAEHKDCQIDQYNIQMVRYGSIMKWKFINAHGHTIIVTLK